MSEVNNHKSLRAVVVGLLSHRVTSLFIILLAILARALQKIHLLIPGGDRAYQVQATKNFIAGNGFSTYEVFAKDLSDPHYIPLIKWPPGYSLLLSPFYALFGNQFVWGTVILDVLSALFFIIISRKLISLFDLPLYIVNLYTLLSGFFLYEFSSSTPTDLVAAVIYQASIYLTLRFLMRDKKTYGDCIVIWLFLFLACLVRYMSIPVSFIIPAYILMHGYVVKNRQLISKGFFLLLLFCCSIGAYLLIQKLSTGSATYIITSEKGFYPETFLRVSPFLFSSFSHLQVPLTMANQYLGVPFASSSHILSVTNLAILLILVLYLLIAIKKKRFAGTIVDHFILLGALSSLAIVGLLIYISLTNKPLSNWTFVEEGRYYFIPVLFIQQLILISWWKKRKSLNKTWRRFFVGCFIAFALSVTYGIYYTAKILRPKTYWPFQDTQEFIIWDYYKNVIDKVVYENPGKQIIVTSPEMAYCNYAFLNNGLPGFAWPGDNELRTKKEVLLVVAVARDQEQYIQPLLKNNNKTIAGTIDNLTVYTILISPSNAYIGN